MDKPIQPTIGSRITGRDIAIVLMVAASALVAFVVPSLTADSDPYGPQISPGRKPVWTANGSIGKPLSVQVVDDMLVVIGAGGVAALDRSNGAMRWQSDVMGDLMISQGALVERHFWNGSYEVKVLDLATGKMQFEVREEGDVRVASTAVAREVLLVLRCDDNDRCELSGLSLKDGRKRWSRQTDTPILPAMPWDDGPNYSAWMGVPQVPASTVAVISKESDHGNALTTIDARTGAHVVSWDYAPDLNSTLLGDLVLSSDCSAAALYEARAAARSWLNSSVCLGATRLVGDYLVDGPGRLIDVNTGRVRWDEPSNANFVGLDGKRAIYHENKTSRTRHFVAADLATGREAWRVPSPAGRTAVEPEREAAAGGRVAFDSDEFDDGDTDHHEVLRVLRAKDGRPLWHSRDTTLLGMGEGWIVGVSGFSEIRYFTV